MKYLIAAILIIILIAVAFNWLRKAKVIKNPGDKDPWVG